MTTFLITVLLKQFLHNFYRQQEIRVNMKSNNQQPTIILYHKLSITVIMSDYMKFLERICRMSFKLNTGSSKILL